jgi:hypothetical protein
MLFGISLVVDDTDTIPELADQIKRLFCDSDGKTFRSVVPGNYVRMKTTTFEKVLVSNEAKASGNSSR